MQREGWKDMARLRYSEEMFKLPNLYSCLLKTPLEGEMAARFRSYVIELPAHLENAHPARQESYRLGRFCASEALREAGYSGPFDLPMNEDGSPAWPAGWSGAISHTTGAVGAAVAEKDELRSVGIDLEPLMKDKTYANIKQKILTESELNDLSVTGRSGKEIATLVFSVKESIYKCYRPICGRFFGFQAAEIFEIDPERNSFRFRLTQDIGKEFTAGYTGQGEFFWSGELVHTLVALKN